MKKAILTILGLVVIGGIILTVGTLETRYTRHAVVTNVEGTMVTVRDTTNNEWMFDADTTNDYKVNDEVKLIMDNNTTDTIITDDVIINVK